MIQSHVVIQCRNKRARRLTQVHRLQTSIKSTRLDGGKSAETLVEFAECLRDKFTVQFISEMMNYLTCWIAAGRMLGPILDLKIVEFRLDMIEDLFDQLQLVVLFAARCGEEFGEWRKLEVIVGRLDLHFFIEITFNHARVCFFYYYCCSSVKFKVDKVQFKFECFVSWMRFIRC